MLFTESRRKYTSSLFQLLFLSFFLKVSAQIEYKIISLTNFSSVSEMTYFVGWGVKLYSLTHSLNQKFSTPLSHRIL